MSTAPDLVRWNRAGLRRFRYLDANAVVFLEQLRADFARRFPQWKEIQAFAEETDLQRRQRMDRQYDEPRTDWAWEIARAFARACHVLGEHLDAYTNEGFLRTTTQWDSVRKLVAALDVRPAPPASASTALVIEAKDEPGILAAGFAVRCSPTDGGGPVVFETLEELAFDPILNGMRLSGWNRSPAKLGDPSSQEQMPAPVGQPGGILPGARSRPDQLLGPGNRPPTQWRAPEGSGISAGQVALVVRTKGDVKAEAEGAVVTIGHVDAETGELALTTLEGQPFWGNWTRDSAHLLARPKTIAMPRLAGSPAAVTLAHAHGLSVGDVVAWRTDKWVFATISEVDKETVLFEETVLFSDFSLPPLGVELFRTFQAERGVKGLFLPLDHRAVAAVTAKGFQPLPRTDLEEVKDAQNVPRLFNVKSLDIQLVAVVHGSMPAAGRVSAVAAPDGDAAFRFEGKPGTLTSGQWVVGDDGTRLLALRVGRVEEFEDHFTMSFAPVGDPAVGAVHRPHRLERLYGVFEHVIRPVGWDRNDMSVTGATLTLERTPPALLGRGRRLVLERAEASNTRHAREATTVSVDAGERVLVVAPPLTAGEGFTYGNLVIRANVVLAGHGETRPPRVLGSGDAAQRSQTLVLQERNVAFVADPAQPAGVAAAVEVEVDGRIWQQAAALRDWGPSDPRYETSLTEDGFLAFTFGDGRQGRRLPTGTSNVRVHFRTGTGGAGNLAAGSLTKPVVPHPRIAAVTQPLLATGGNDAEDITSLKSQGPASVLTLERAVSLADFAALAARHASVWQARAFALPTSDRRYASVEVVVVPAGGGPLGTLSAGLESFLRAHALPAVDVRVTPFESARFDLAVEVQVRTAAFDPAEVKKSVRAALLDSFSLRRRRLGADLYASDVYAAVEGVKGVESSLVVLGVRMGAETAEGRSGVGSPPMILGVPTVGRIVASDRQVIHLDPVKSFFEIYVREFEL